MPSHVMKWIVFVLIMVIIQCSNISLRHIIHITLTDRVFAYYSVEPHL